MKRETKIMKHIDRVHSRILPVSLQIAVTDYCNNTCFMCGHHERKKKDHLDHEQLINFLQSNPEVESVCYSGGDPVCHPYINDILSYHVNSNTAFGLITGGYLYGIDMCLLSKARWVRVSLDSVNPKVYQKCRPGKYTLFDIVSSIMRAKRKGVNIEINATISQKNMEDIDELFRWCIGEKIPLMIHPLYGGKFPHSLNIDRWINLFSIAGVPFEVVEYNKPPKQYRCRACYYQNFIDAQGWIYPCCIVAGDTTSEAKGRPLGNMYHLGDNYFKNRYKFSEKYIPYPDICKNCTERFSSINRVVEENYRTKNKQSFF